jgi:hypothetical protein
MRRDRDITLDSKRRGAMLPRENLRAWRSILGSGILRCRHRWWKNIGTGSGPGMMRSCIVERRLRLRGIDWAYGINC